LTTKTILILKNPIIKFTTLFGLLAMETAISESFRNMALYVGGVFLVVTLFFVWRSFYGMRIPLRDNKSPSKEVLKEPTADQE
jgi:K(+)-stimulated pyrophosphate-energized sodium pump